jgi:hypothetical protein
MPKSEVEPELAEKLATVKCDAVLYDATGRVLGFFSPMRDPTRLEDMQLEPPRIREETDELRKRARANPGRPLKEILADWVLPVVVFDVCIAAM